MTLRIKLEISKGISWCDAYSLIKIYIGPWIMSTESSRTIMILNDLFMLSKIVEQEFLF